MIYIDFNYVIKKPQLKRVLMEVFGGCNYSCSMYPSLLVEEKILQENAPYNI